MAFIFGLSLFVLKKDKLFFIFYIIFILSEALIFFQEKEQLFFINLSAIFIIIFSSQLAKLRLFTLVIFNINCYYKQF